jgi:hypothetical protein
MKIHYGQTPAREAHPRVEDWEYKVYWETMEDQREDRRAVAMYPSVVFKGYCYCVLYTDDEHIVWTYVPAGATREFETMKDLARCGALEFEE